MKEYVLKVVHRFNAFDDAEARKFVNSLKYLLPSSDKGISIPLSEDSEIRLLQHGSCENILLRGNVE